MTHVTCRLIAKNRDQLRNPTLDNRIWATFTFLHGDKTDYKTQLEVDGKPVRECLRPGTHAGTHAQTDGQPENITPPVQ